NAIIGAIVVALAAGVIAFGGFGGSPAAVTGSASPGTGGGAGASASAALPGATVTATITASVAPTVAPSSGPDFSKVQWTIYTQVTNAANGTGKCRYLVSTNISFIAAPDVAQALIGKTAIVTIDGPAQPRQIEVTL